MPLWEGEGGGGGNGGGDGGGGGGDQQQQQQQQPAGSWTPPKELTVPTEYLGTTAEDTLGKVLKAHGELNTRAEGLRTQLASKPSAPAKPEDYTFKPGEKVAAYFPEPDKHPALNAAKGVFHKHGVSQTAFEGIINELYGGMAEAGTLAAPYNPKAEVANYAKQFGVDENVVGQHFQENVAFVGGLFAQLQGSIPPTLAKEAQAELEMLTDTAAGNALLRALTSRLSQSGIRITGQPGNQDGPLDDAELDKMTADPRIDPRNQNHKDADKRYDPALRAKYDAGMAERGKKQNR